MQIKIDNNVIIDIFEKDVISWSYERITGIYTIILKDGTVWKYETGKNMFYKLT